MANLARDCRADQVDPILQVIPTSERGRSGGWTDGAVEERCAMRSGAAKRATAGAHQPTLALRSQRVDADEPKIRACRSKPRSSKQGRRGAQASRITPRRLHLHALLPPSSFINLIASSAVIKVWAALDRHRLGTERWQLRWHDRQRSARPLLRTMRQVLIHRKPSAFRLFTPFRHSTLCSPIRYLARSSSHSGARSSWTSAATTASSHWRRCPRLMRRQGTERPPIRTRACLPTAPSSAACHPRRYGRSCRIS